jgi:heterodisulfide reductase subunit C
MSDKFPKIKKVVLGPKNSEFLKKVEELSGETVTLCEQCGTCSGSCPMVLEMDITPSQMMRMVQLGEEEVLENKTFWICASCYTCSVRCPRGIDPAKVAEALRQIKLRSAFDFLDISKITEEEAKKLPQIALVAAFRKFTG